jgi:hypothetical protein
MPRITRINAGGSRKKLLTSRLGPVARISAPPSAAMTTPTRPPFRKVAALSADRARMVPKTTPTSG